VIEVNIHELVLYENENSRLDFKAKQYDTSNTKDKVSFLKDLISLANASIEGERHIIVGVKAYPDGKKNFEPIVDFVDDANYQDLVRQNITPEIKFLYESYVVEGNRIGIFTIGSCYEAPYMMKKKYENLNEGDSFIRRGSQQFRLTHSDFEKIYASRYKKEKQKELKDSYIYLLKHEFKTNRNILYDMQSFVGVGPVIVELWDTAKEICNHFEFDTWGVIIRSGVVGYLELNEIEAYRIATNDSKLAIRTVRTIAANWQRIIMWDSIPTDELRQPIPTKVTLHSYVTQCEEAIKKALRSIDTAIELLETKY
jgi:hypothetical protein